MIVNFKAKLMRNQVRGLSYTALQQEISYNPWMDAYHEVGDIAHGVIHNEIQTQIMSELRDAIKLG